MSYLVLARKWRPQNFEEVVGQQVITKTLKNALTQNRVAHALLFCGPRGVGKTSVARILAKAVNCERGPTPDPCGICPACTEIAHGTSLDIHEIDGASNNGVDEIRKLKETVAYLPVTLRYKVYIIDEVHMLSKGAFNALLKTLEEPPEHVIFILATTEPHKIPVTILSRCQRYDFRRIPFQDMIMHLEKIIKKEGFEADEKALMLVARESTGSLRDAEVILDQLFLLSEEKRITFEDARSLLSVVDSTVMMKVLECIIKESPEELLTLIHQLVDAGTDLAYFYRSFLLFLHDLLLLKAAGDRKIPLERGSEEIHQMQEMIRPVPLEQIEHWIHLLHERERFILQSEYARIGLETALVRMIHLKQAVSLNSLIRQLEEKLGYSKDASIPPKSRETGPVSPQLSSSPSNHRKPTSHTTDTHPPQEPVDNFFEEFLRFAKKRAMALSVQLSEATGFQWRGKVAEIQFPSQSFALKLLDTPEKEAQLKALLEKFTGHEVARVVFKEGGDIKAPSGNGQETPTKGGFREHPVIQDILGILGGHLIEVKPIEKDQRR